MLHDFGPKQLKLKRGDIRVKTRGGLTALVWKDRREVYMLTNMDPPPAERNFCSLAGSNPRTLFQWLHVLSSVYVLSIPFPSLDLRGHLNFPSPSPKVFI
jgi:hypothetical protein